MAKGKFVSSLIDMVEKSGSQLPNDLRVVDLFGDGSRVQYHDDKKGLFFENQKLRNGNEYWQPGEMIDGMDYKLGDSTYSSINDAKDAVGKLRAQNTKRKNYNEKYGAIPSTWDGEAKKVAKQVIDAGYDVDRFSNSTQSKSKYIYLNDGTKIRLSDHDLPASYEQPDINHFYGSDLTETLNKIKIMRTNLNALIFKLIILLILYLIFSLI